MPIGHSYSLPSYCTRVTWLKRHSHQWLSGNDPKDVSCNKFLTSGPYIRHFIKFLTAFLLNKQVLLVSLKNMKPTIDNAVCIYRKFELTSNMVSIYIFFQIIINKVFMSYQLWLESHSTLILWLTQHKAKTQFTQRKSLTIL